MPRGFQPGNKLGGRTPGSKNRTTLLKEERRAIFEARVSQKWEETIDKLRPEYIADQFLGKAVEKHEHIVTNLPSDELIQLADGLKQIQQRGLDSGS